MQIPLDFSDAAFDSLRQETTLNTVALGRVSGQVNRYDPAFLEGTIRLFNVDRPALKLSAPLGAGGAFSFAAADLFPADPGMYRFMAVVKSRHADYEARPDTLRLTVDKRARVPWTLDLDLLDAGAFEALGQDTSATGVIDGWIAGRINGYQPSLVKDSVWLQLREYPDQNLALPLDAEGRFGFEAIDLFSGQDGSITLRILVKTKETFRKPVPDRITIDLLRGQAP